MSLTRNHEQELGVAGKRLHKDIWANLILPKLENKDLLNLSATSKEARQAAFVELFNRPAFKDKIDRDITLSSRQASRNLFHREKALFGETALPYALRVSQFTMHLLTLLLMEITFHTYQNGYPSAAELDEDLKKRIASPMYGTEFDSPTTLSLVGMFPDDNCITLSLTILSLVILSFTCRALFLRSNRPAIQKAHSEYEERSANNLKSVRLTYLRDQLPRESIVTHSLFATVERSVTNERVVPLPCNIL